MKNLFKSNKFTSAFYEVLSSPVGDENKAESYGPVLEIRVTNPLKDLSGSISAQRIAGV